MSLLAFVLRGAEFPLVIVFAGMAFVYLMTRIAARERDHKRRLELVEKALQGGAIDDATKRELLEAVGAKPRNPGHHPVFLIAWIGLFAGLGMIVLAFNDHDWWEPSVLMTAVSFGVLTVPLAMRELQMRRTA